MGGFLYLVLLLELGNTNTLIIMMCIGIMVYIVVLLWLKDPIGMMVSSIVWTKIKCKSW